MPDGSGPTDPLVPWKALAPAMCGCADLGVRRAAGGAVCCLGLRGYRGQLLLWLSTPHSHQGGHCSSPPDAGLSLTPKGQMEASLDLLVGPAPRTWGEPGPPAWAGACPLTRVRSGPRPHSTLGWSRGQSRRPCPVSPVSGRVRLAVLPEDGLQMKWKGSEGNSLRYLAQVTHGR